MTLLRCRDSARPSRILCIPLVHYYYPALPASRGLPWTPCPWFGPHPHPRITRGCPPEKPRAAPDVHATRRSRAAHRPRIAHAGPHLGASWMSRHYPGTPCPAPPWTAPMPEPWPTLSSTRSTAANRTWPGGHAPAASHLSSNAPVAPSSPV